ncbi:MAG: histidine--tRNA ligase [Planctomycetota bacterium]
MGEGISTQAVKGTRDFYPEDLAVRSWLFAQWREVAAAFGYVEYDACVLEHEELYTRKAGDEITGQLYNFTDKGGRQVALRPEMTPSLARMVMARAGSLALPLRWYAIPQCFRYERMQKGRKREHFQWNMDVVGLAHVAAEAELMAAQIAFLRRTGLDLDGDPAVRIRVSNRRILQGVLEREGVTGEDFAAVCVIIDKRDKIGRDATAEQLVATGVATPTTERVLDLLELRGLDALVARLGDELPGIDELRELGELAAAAGFGHLLEIDLSVVRGLSYYTGVVWELFATSGSMRAIAGGGRYDALMATLGGRAVPMVGFGFGDVVILDLLAEHGLLPAPARAVDDVVFPMQQAQFLAANRIAATLRARGRRVVVDYSCRRFKHVIKAAEQDRAEYCYIIGDDELARGMCKRRRVGERDEEELALTTV